VQDVASGGRNDAGVVTPFPQGDGSSRVLQMFLLAAMATSVGVLTFTLLKE
jgi:hypothetical protein